MFTLSRAAVVPRKMARFARQALLGLSICSPLVLGGLASASIVYEGFDYTPGSYTFNTLPAGGQGFSSSSPNWFDRIDIRSQGLTHPSALPSSGNSARAGFNARSISALPFQAAATTWVSFLTNSAGSSNAEVLLQLSGPSTLNISTIGTRLRLFSGVFGQPAITVESAPGLASVSNTNFVLARLTQFNSAPTTRVEAWVNPSNLLALGAAHVSLDIARLVPSGIAISTPTLIDAAIDEVRLDTSLSGVAIPAPGATIGVLGLGLARIARPRRRS